MLTGHRLRLNRPIYYIAGPSGMVTAMTALLKCSGVNEDDMRTEEFVKSFRKNGGDDETRTRDLCRDRVAFRWNLVIQNGTDNPPAEPQGTDRHNFLDPDRTQIQFHIFN